VLVVGGVGSRSYGDLLLTWVGERRGRRILCVEWTGLVGTAALGVVVVGAGRVAWPAVRCGGRR